MALVQNGSQSMFPGGMWLLFLNICRSGREEEVTVCEGALRGSAPSEDLEFLHTRGQAEAGRTPGRGWKMWLKQQLGIWVLTFRLVNGRKTEEWQGSQPPRWTSMTPASWHSSPCAGPSHTELGLAVWPTYWDASHRRWLLGPGHRRHCSLQLGVLHYSLWEKPASCAKDSQTILWETMWRGGASWAAWAWNCMSRPPAGADCPAPVKPSDDSRPSRHLITTPQETLIQTHSAEPLLNSRLMDSMREKNDYHCFQPVGLRVVCDTSSVIFDCGISFQFSLVITIYVTFIYFLFFISLLIWFIFNWGIINIQCHICFRRMI